MDNVHVAIRLRPFIKRESESDAHHHWKAEGKNVQQYDARGKSIGKPYTFDRVFDEIETTADVYEEIAKPIIVSAMDGYDGTIFAYGQTSSGKTFTMQGSRLSPGIIPSTVNEVFETIENTPDREFLLRVSYAELYNEGITDLLSDEKKQLSIRENGERVYVSNLTEEVCTSSSQILNLMRKGDARRHVGRTNMNEHSSRSHTIFCMIIESRGRRQEGEGAVKVAHLNLVDLAGSERANETKAEGTRFKEACNINQSLFVLGTVINRLASGAEFVPFRDSKLTRILSSSLGGNAKTAIICTITAASFEQTQSTLQFATRAKTIKNKPVMNEILSDEALMQRMKKEIQSLKKKLEGSQAPSALTDGEKEALLSQERERMKKEVMKEMQEKMDYFNNMVVVSKGGGTPKKQLKRKPRRETWCPGMQLQPLILPHPAMLKTQKSPISEVSDASPTSLQDISEVDPRTSISSESVSSVSSSEFNDENANAFQAEVLNVDSEAFRDTDFLDLDVNYSRKTKRRRANVHFGEDAVYSFTPEEFSREMACQTEVVQSDQVREMQVVLETLTEENAALTEENATLTEENVALRGRLEELQTKEVNQDQVQESEEILVMRAELEMSSALCDALQEEKDQLQAKLNETSQDAAQATQTHHPDVDKLKGELMESLTLCEALSEEKNQLQSTLEEVQKELAMRTDQQADITKLKEEIAELRFELMQKSEEYAELQQFTRWEDKSLKDQEIEYLQEINKLQEILKQKDKDVKEIETKITAQLTQSENEKKDLDFQLDAEKERHRSMTSELRQQLQEAYDRLKEKEGAGGASAEEQIETEREDSEKVVELESRLAEVLREMESFKKESGKEEMVKELEAKLADALQDKNVMEEEIVPELESRLANILLEMEDLKKAETEREEKVADLEAKLAIVVQEKETLREEETLKEQKIMELESRFAIVLQEQEEGLKEEKFMELETKLASVLQETEALKEEKNLKEEKIAELNSLLASIPEEDVDVQSEKVTQLESHLAGLLQEGESLKEGEACKNEKIAELESRLDEAMQEKEIGEESKTAELEARLATVLEETEALREEKNGKEEQIINLEARLASVQQDLGSGEEGKVVELESSLNNVLKEVNDLKEEKALREQKIAQLESWLTSGMQEIEGLMEEKKTREAQMTELEARLATVSKELDEEGKVAELESHLTNVLGEMDTLREEKNSNKDKVVELESQLTGVLQEMETLKEEKIVKDEHITELESRLAIILHEKKSGEEDKVAELETHLTGVLKELEVLKEEKNLKEDKFLEMESHLDGVLQELETLKMEKNSREEQNSELESRLASISQEQDTLRVEKVAEMESKLASVLQEMEDYKEAKSLKEEQVADLESRLANVSQELETLKEEKAVGVESRLSCVLEEMEELKEEKNLIEARVAELESRLANVSQEQDNLKEEKANELELRLSCVLQEMDALKVEEKLKEEKVTMVETRLAEVLNDMESLQDELTRINEEKTKLEAINHEIMSQMQKDVVTMETQTEEEDVAKVEPSQDLHAALEKFHQVLASKEQEISEVKAQSSHEIRRLEELQRCFEEESREHEERITAELDYLEKERTRLVAALTKAELELGDSVSETRLLKEEMEVMESKLAEEREMVSSRKEQQLEELMVELDSARNLLAQKEDEVEKLQEFMKLENEEAVKQEAQAHHEIKRLHNLLQHLEEESKEAKMQIGKECEHRWQGVCEELRSAIGELEREKQRLEEALRNVEEKQVQSRQASEQKLQGESEELRRTMDESRREKQRLEEALRDAVEKQELLEKEVKKRKEEVKRVRIEAMKEACDWEERTNTICGEIQEELDAEQAKVKEAKEKSTQFEALCEELKEELKSKVEEIDRVKEDRRDIFNKKEMLEKQYAKMKKQVKQTVLNSIREVSEAEARAKTVCGELEEELEAEKTKVKEAQEKVECQAKHICELEVQLQSQVNQSKGGNATTRSLESELSAKKRELTVLEMEHTREILKMEDRIRDLESEKKFLDEKNREYRNELRREHQKAANNSVLSTANYPEAGICGSGASYDVSVFSLRCENEAMGKDLKLTQKKYETLKTQRDEQVTRNSKLKQEVLNWKGRYDKLKSFVEQKSKESRASQPLTDCNTEHPGIPSSAVEGGASPPRGEMRVGGELAYQGTLQERMFEMFKTKKQEPTDNPEECTTQ